MFALVLLIACGSPEPTPAPEAPPVTASATHPATHPETPPAAPAVTGASIYQLPVSMTDTTGAAAKLDIWLGHPVLVSMIYTSCASACPLIITDMKTVDLGLSAEARPNMRYLLVSMDPAHDTPDALAQLRVEHNLDERWSVLGTNEDGVRQIAAVLGVRYRLLADGGYNHSAVLTLLDADGQIQQRLDGLGQPHEALITAAEALARAQP